MAFDWKALVSSVAPMLGAALGGPLGGIAGQALGQVLGCPSDQKTLEKTILGATGDQLIAIAKADQEFRLQMERLGFENEQALQKLASDDRSSARAREVSTGDSWTPRILSAFVISGWISIQFFLLINVIDPSMREIIVRLLGTLDASLMLVLSYYFGSSAGSQLKTLMMKGGNNERS